MPITCRCAFANYKVAVSYPLGHDPRFSFALPAPVMLKGKNRQAPPPPKVASRTMAVKAKGGGKAPALPPKVRGKSAAVPLKTPVVASTPPPAQPTAHIVTEAPNARTKAIALPAEGNSGVRTKNTKSALQNKAAGRSKLPTVPPKNG